MNEIVPREVLVKQGMKAVGGIGGGVGLLILGAFTGATIPAIIIGGVLTAIGLAITSRSKDDKLAGGITAGAGILTILKGLLGAGWLITLPGIGLLVAGGVSLYKFIKGLRSRG